MDSFEPAVRTVLAENSALEDCGKFLIKCTACNQFFANPSADALLGHIKSQKHDILVEVNGLTDDITEQNRLFKIKLLIRNNSSRLSFRDNKLFCSCCPTEFKKLTSKEVSNHWRKHSNKPKIQNHSLSSVHQSPLSPPKPFLTTTIQEVNSNISCEEETCYVGINQLESTIDSINSASNVTDSDIAYIMETSTVVSPSRTRLSPDHNKQVRRVIMKNQYNTMNKLVKRCNEKNRKTIEKDKSLEVNSEQQNQSSDENFEVGDGQNDRDNVESDDEKDHITLSENVVACETCARHFKNCRNISRNVDRHLSGPRHKQEANNLETPKKASIDYTGYIPRESPNCRTPKKCDLCPVSRLVGKEMAKKAAKIVFKHGKPFSSAENELRYEIVTKCGRYISSSTIRKVGFPALVEELRSKLRLALVDKNIFMIVDETTKGTGKSRAPYTAAIIGSLDKDMKVYSFFMEKFDESPNADRIVEFVDKTLKLLWPDNPKEAEERFNVFISDGAHYMKSAAGKLKEKYTKMTPVTCVAHALHLVCEEVKKQFPDTNLFIGLMKQSLARSTNRKNLFLSQFQDQSPVEGELLADLNQLIEDAQLTGEEFFRVDDKVKSSSKKRKKVSLPPTPSTTRWGTWLITACYYYHHLEEARKFINLIPNELNDKEETGRISRLRDLINSNYEDIKSDLAFIYENYCLLPLFITELETSKLKLCQAMGIVKNANNYVHNAALKNADKIMSKAADNVYKKTQNLWKKNKGLRDICERACIDPYIEYSPIVSVACESFFRGFAPILRFTANCTPENRCHYMLVRSNIVARDAMLKDKKRKIKNMHLSAEQLTEWRGRWSTLKNEKFRVPETIDLSFIPSPPKPKQQKKRKAISTTQATRKSTSTKRSNSVSLPTRRFTRTVTIPKRFRVEENENFSEDIDAILDSDEFDYKIEFKSKSLTIEEHSDIDEPEDIQVEVDPFDVEEMLWDNEITTALFDGINGKDGKESTNKNGTKRKRKAKGNKSVKKRLF